MLFASIELAARIELAETRLLGGAIRAVQRRRPAAEAIARPIAGGLAALADEGSPLCKVAGLGFGGPLDAAELDALEATWASRGQRVQVELSTLGDPSIGALLTGRGYLLRGFENVLGFALPAAPPSRAGAAVAVDVDASDDVGPWLAAMVTGFATPDGQGVASHESFPREALERAVGDFGCIDTAIRYLARLDGVVAGGASLHLQDGVAQLCGAATLPEQRRRGVQSALLARRLADAAARGCDVAVLTTQPGSKSMENAQRQGFELLYSRAVLVRER